MAPPQFSGVALAPCTPVVPGTAPKPNLSALCGYPVGPRGVAAHEMALQAA